MKIVTHSVTRFQGETSLEVILSNIATAIVTLNLVGFKEEINLSSKQYSTEVKVMMTQATLLRYYVTRARTIFIFLRRLRLYVFAPRFLMLLLLLE